MSLNRVGKENSINFMSIDFDALDAEIKATQEAKEASRSCQNKANAVNNISKQSSGQLYKQQAQNSMMFLENDVPAPESKPETPIDAKPQARLNNKFEGENLRTMNSKSIFSATTGDVRDTGGGNRRMNSSICNSIFDNNAIGEAVEKRELTAREKTQRDKEAQANHKTESQEERLSEIVNSLKETDTRKASHISSMGSMDGSSYQKTNNNLSIFDFMEGSNTQLDFERLPEKTAGEEIASKREQERNQIDDSWRSNKGQKTINNSLSQLWEK